MATTTVARGHDGAAAGAALGGRDVLVAALVVAAAALVGGLAFADQLTEDAAAYARQILAPGKDFFHPHHLLYNLAVRLLAWPTPALAEGTDPWQAVEILQWINLGVTALAPGLLFLVARRLAVPAWPALALALVLGFAFRFLTFGTQTEVYNFALTALTLATLGLALPEDSRAAPWLVAVGYFLAMGFHQTALFFGAAVLVLAWGRARPFRWLAIAFVLPGAAIAAAYLAAGLYLGHADPGSLWRWLTAYAQTGSWGKGTTSVETVAGAVRGFSLAWGQNGGEALVLVLLLAVAGLALTTGWRREAARRRLVLAMGAFLLPLALFNAWWYGRNPEFWIMAALPIATALAAMIGAGPGRRPRLLAGALAALVLAQTALLAIEAVAVAESDGLDAALADAGRVARPGDLLLAVDTRTVSFLDLHLLGRGVGLEPLSVVALRAEQGGADAARALADAIGAWAAQARARGTRLLLDRALLAEPSQARGLQDIDRARLRALLAPILGPALDAPAAAGRFVPVVG